MTVKLPSPIEIGDFRLLFRQVIIGTRAYAVPRSIGRTERDKCWHVKVERNGTRLLFKTFYDSQYLSSPEESLKAAIKCLIGFLKTCEKDQVSTAARKTNKSALINSNTRMFWTIARSLSYLQTTVYMPALKKSKPIHAGTGKHLDTAKIALMLKKALWLNERLEAGEDQEYLFGLKADELGESQNIALVKEILQREDVLTVLRMRSQMVAKAEATRPVKCPQDE